MALIWVFDSEKGIFGINIYLLSGEKQVITNTHGLQLTNLYSI